MTYTAYVVLMVLVALERLNELRLSKRNAALAFARGGIEVGHTHYRVMTALHTLFLVSCLAEPVLLGRTFPGLLGWLALVVVVLAQALRVWVISSLGERWNTRVIVVPYSEPVTTGVYRYLKHPNYVAVIAEIAALPLVFGGWWTAIVFSVANAMLLVVRIRVEEEALGRRWQAAFAGLSRFVPSSRRSAHSPHSL